MSKPQNCYLQIQALLAPEIERLEKITRDLREKDRRKYSQLREKCRSCGAQLDWYALLGGDAIRPDASGDFDITALIDVKTHIVCSACGTEVGFDLLFRRGASELSDQRRKVYEDCRSKLRNAAGLTSDQIDVLLRFIFRHAIVRNVIALEAIERSSGNAIELVGVHRSFRLGDTMVAALRDVDFTVAKGEFVALVGSSGAGKSTLLNIVGCIDKPSQGRVLIDGIDAGVLDETRRADLRNRKIGFVFQSFNLLPVLDVFENVELPLLAQRDLHRDDRRERVQRAVESVGLGRFANHRPDQLSGGQRQRVAIARALVIEPAIVVADEPTANLDSATAHQVVNVMAEMNELYSVTFLFSTHDEKLISRVRRIVTISDGMIADK